MAWRRPSSAEEGGHIPSQELGGSMDQGRGAGRFLVQPQLQIPRDSVPRGALQGPELLSRKAAWKSRSNLLTWRVQDCS